MSDENLSFEKKLYKVVAYNLKLARGIAGLTLREAQTAIWGYRNEVMFANRVSEMESGNKKIELKTVLKACEVYGCSADFIFGFSDEFERDNLAAKQAGMVFQSIRGSVLEAAEQICMNVSHSITRLPKFQGEMLKTSARQFVDVFDRLSHDLAFKGQYPDLVESAQELKKNVVMFEIYVAKQQRQLELSMMSLLENEDDETSSRKLTQHIEMKKPEKV